jgi:hypothetical protein
MTVRPVPKKAVWYTPDKKKRMTGTVIKEKWIEEHYPHGDYLKTIQVIKPDDGGEEIIRMGYYLKRKGQPFKKYHWGSQTTIMMPKKNFKKLIEKAQKSEII